MRGERHGGVGGVEGEELGAEFGEIDFLRVGGAVGVCWGGGVFLAGDVMRGGGMRDGGGVWFLFNTFF